MSPFPLALRAVHQLLLFVVKATTPFTLLVAERCTTERLLAHPTTSHPSGNEENNHSAEETAQGKPERDIAEGLRLILLNQDDTVVERGLSGADFIALHRFYTAVQQEDNGEQEEQPAEDAKESFHVIELGPRGLGG